MITQKCAICEVDNSVLLYSENFDAKRLDAATFSARRLPDQIHYRMVKCRQCGLIYSNPVLEFEKIKMLYKKSFTTYDTHVDNLKKTYGHYLKSLKKYHVTKKTLLEIGCGNGFFLEEAKAQGYAQVYGVEPGEKSVKKARASIRKNIKVDVFKPGLFAPNFFDVICCFQTFDHVPDPNGLLSECYTVLKKGGLVLFFNHNAEALQAKILREKSPIIDIEHTYLYSKKTMSQIFEKHGFKVLSVKTAFNIHNLGYWLHLFPLPKHIKQSVINSLKIIKLDGVKIPMFAGNLVLIAQK